MQYSKMVTNNELHLTQSRAGLNSAAVHSVNKSFNPEGGLKTMILASK